MGKLNQYYDNFVLQNEIKHMYKTSLDMLQFCTPDTTLMSEAGDKVKINTYDATSAAKVVGLGEGNDSAITTTMSTKEYTVKEVQTRFAYLDEEARQDPNVPIVGARKLVPDLVNQMNTDIFKAFHEATLYVKATSDYFNDFIDAVAKLTLDADHADNGDESLNPTAMCFALANKTEIAKIRKSLKEQLKYVEAFARTGYVGTVAGVNIYVSDMCTDGEVIVGHKAGVKLITKENISTATDREENIRKNWLYARDAYVVALHDATKVCIINATGAKATA